MLRRERRCDEDRRRENREEDRECDELFFSRRGEREKRGYARGEGPSVFGLLSSFDEKTRKQPPPKESGSLSFFSLSLLLFPMITILYLCGPVFELLFLSPLPSSTDYILLHHHANSKKWGIAPGCLLPHDIAMDIGHDPRQGKDAEEGGCRRKHTKED